MTCPTCPVTLKKALMKEQGVASVTVRYEKKELIVSFDDAKTTPDAIMKSTAAVGFPSQIAKEGCGRMGISRRNLCLAVPFTFMT
jgi:mercuric ion binding protein